MSPFVMTCSRAYRRMARAFPRRYRAICGDGLEQLGDDMVPRVWQEQGVVGLIRLFGDLALRLPYEHVSTWADRLREATMADDVFEGTWRARQSEPTVWKKVVNAQLKALPALSPGCHHVARAPQPMPFAAGRRSAIVREGWRPAALGAAAGVIVAAGVSRLLAAQPYGVSPNDPISYAAPVAAIGIAALVAS